jgi:branched-chain amino acid transport system ATP-binding protein
MLNINNIEVVYNDVILVLKGISLEVPEGEVVALLGANGAGKSTMLKAVSGLLDYENGEITDGTIEFGGARIDRRAPEDIVRMGICQVPEGRRIFSDLSVSENIMIGAHTCTDKARIRQNHAMVVSYFPILESRSSQRALFLSGGEQQMLSIARALMSMPKLVMLDEPSLGLAPILVKEIFRILEDIIGRRRPPFSSWNRTPSWPCSWQTTATFWKTGRSFLTTRAASSSKTKTLRNFTWASPTSREGKASWT